MLYHQAKIPDEVIEIIAGSQPEIAGMTASPETILVAVKMMVEAGTMAVFHHGPLVVLIRAYTPYVGIVHFCFAPDPSPFALIRAGKAFTAWARSGTQYHRLEGRTHNLRLALLATHCGATIEGVRKESWRTPDGQMADEYELGYILSTTEH